MSNQSKIQALKWIEKNEPAVFSLALKRYKLQRGETTGLHGMEAINWGAIGGSVGGFFNTVADTVKNVLPSVVAYKTQNKVLDAQLKRGEQGLPPLNVADYSPVLTINPRLDPAGEAALTRVAVASTQSGVEKMLPLLAIGGAGILAIMMLRKKRR